jgi:hypothetical protein
VPDDPPAIRGFRVTLTAIGALYVLLAASMLLRGVGVMRDFAVPAGVVTSPVFEDFFLFFYELMAAQGVLIATFGQVVRERRLQTRVALLLCTWNLYLTWRDLSTSVLGNRLYQGEATLIPVCIDFAIALLLARLAWLGRRSVCIRA